MVGAKHSTRSFARPWLLVVVASCACGGPNRVGPPPDALEKARTVLAPDGNRCPDPVRDTQPVAILPDAGDARPVGRITATRHHRDEERACLWAEDGAASAARRLGGDAVVVLSREVEEEDDEDTVACVVKVRVLVRSEEEFLNECAREEIEGVQVEDEDARAQDAPTSPPR